MTRSAESDRWCGQAIEDWWKRRADTLIDRPFDPAMKPATVLQLSRAWHDRVATVQAANVTFPKPWYASGTVGDLTIEPLDSPVALSRAAHRLHNCSATYAGQVASGDVFLYAIRDAKTVVAMAELRRRVDDFPELHQLAGPCNAKVAKPVDQAVRKWLRERIRTEGRIKPKPKAPAPWDWEALGGDDDCPF